MEKTIAVIRKVGNEYCVFSHSGQNLGCSSSEDGAKKRLQQVEYFKNKGSNMTYDAAFKNMAKALNTDSVDPTQLGKAPDATPPTVAVESDLSVSDKLRVGTLASRQSSRVLDAKDHFPVITQTQAQSSMARVLQLTDAPTWYNGTIAALRQDVYDGIMSLHPAITFNVRVPVEHAVALSDGQTSPQTSKTKIKDPADVAKKEVPQVARPTLTSAQMIIALEDEEARKAVAGRLMEIVDEQIGKLDAAKKLATRLLKSGLKAEEFDSLSTFIQNDVLNELLYVAKSKSAANIEDRRLELITRLRAQNTQE